jgi:hypothetical protein
MPVAVCLPLLEVMAATGLMAAAAAELIFDRRPELTQMVDFCFLQTQDSTVGGFIKNAMRCVGCRT